MSATACMILSASMMAPLWPQDARVGSSDTTPIWIDALGIEAGVVMTVDSLTTSATDMARATGQSIENGGELRRFRFDLRGQAAPDIKWRTHFDTTEGDPFLLDIWAEANLSEAASLRFGRFREPMGLEGLVSSKYIAFTERSSPIDAFAPGRANGVMFDTNWADGSAGTSLGIFSPADAWDEDIHEDALHATGRLTWLPVEQEDEQRLLHVGAALHHRESLRGSERFSARPAAHLLPKLVDTGSFVADRVNISGLELLYIDGPVMLQAEYLAAATERPGASEVHFDGAYVQGTWCLTGESRSYSRSKRSPKAIKPRTSIRDGGVGAWELALRFSELDLTDADVRGGELRNRLLGLNWFASEHLRMTFDWVHTEHKVSDQSAELFLVRMQFAF
ncbi:MAG: phosphate-selective porin OprO/OprP [Planctomycetota bacterium]|jgi:phosphate-selective porin OprO/OprP